ncbi:CotH protein [Breznakibacter xylanolyticus]|uniref:CotH protein n=1 Tax=Breznakibacter xylanolyticus TaxID=990 RepID=A0A2W7NQJ2_9BACT|nr:CotH kinase family protein [Breznakibacter xylanolyticus]PZX20337.1 CotH protein [Breznakibacter xylanolyticus]
MKKLLPLSTFLMLLMLAGCHDDADDVGGSVARITSFAVDGHLFSLEGAAFTCFIPDDIDKTTLVADFEATGQVFVNGVPQLSGVTANDFTPALLYTVVNDDGSRQEYTVRLVTFTRLPRIHIDTDNGLPITSKDVYVTARVAIDPNHDVPSSPATLTGRVRGRGNSTWEMPKKSYKIKFDQSYPILGERPHREWVLLANYADKTLLRNALAFQLSRHMGMSFTPCAHYVELYVNNVHMGNYLLTDQVEVAPYRVDVDELDVSDDGAMEITGGWLLEVNQAVLRKLDEPFFETEYYPIVVKSPEAPTAAQMSYIRQYFWDFEYTLYTDGFKDPVNGFRKFMDDTTMVKWFIINELFKNVDAQRYGSIYFYKARSQKLKMGPVWDFDLSSGNAFHNPDCMLPTGWYVKENKWIVRMMEDEAFRALVKATWQQHRNHIGALLTDIDGLVERLELSLAINEKLWPKYHDPADYVVPNINTYDGQVQWLSDFLSQRMAWMDAQLAGW